MLAEEYAWTLIGQSCLCAMWERLCRLLHIRQETLPLDHAAAAHFLSFLSPFLSILLLPQTPHPPFFLARVLTKVEEVRIWG